MNKLANILVLILFLISFVGVNIHKHYSNGKLYSFAIYEEAESCCADKNHCEMADKHILCEQHQQDDDCSCKNETEIIKITDVFVDENYTFPCINMVSIFNLEFFYYSDWKNIANYNSIDSYSLPPLVINNVQAEHCVFII